ncbi:Isoleucine--tRNA ligase [Talaromyces islandicus]|uniref:Isoleucine--tRNA ligase n=1 Tax=Talaromyces islandicus TaxID=28573 RepID=A0A0U1M9S4_TALIS|nr:Isoleucine--tRNA ligase [Talaromyces islandicus]
MADPTLEGLPIELKVLVLFEVQDGDTLKSLVLASPGYHQAYRTVRPKLLKYLVKCQYSGFLDLAEALTAVRSEGVHFSLGVENAIFVLDNWRRRSELRGPNKPSTDSLDEPNSMEEIIKLLHFHKMLRFFLDDYSINAPRPPWIQPIEWEGKCLPLQLSLSERSRFLRAMCRLQIMKNIFGDPVYCLEHERCSSCWETKIWQSVETDELRDLQGPHHIYFIHEQAYRLFYGTIPPWEHEEMGSVFSYLVTKIKAISNEIADDLRQLSKSTPCEFFWDILPIEQRPPPCDIEVESDLVHFNQHVKGLAGLGPKFLYRILHMDQLSRRNIVCYNTRGFWPGPFIGLGTELPWDYKFPFTDPADRHDCQNFEQFWSTLSPIEQPTIGWKKKWLLPHNEEDNLEDSLNYEREHEKEWEWSYALWDDRRLQEWKAPLLDSP